MSATDTAAIIARIRGTGPTALNVHDTRPDSPTYPYVVVYSGAGLASSDREVDERTTHSVPWQTTVVGQSVAQCRAALDRVTDRLENWTPDIAGRSCSKVEHESSQPMRPDESLPDRVVIYATDQWSYISTPS